MSGLWWKGTRSRKKGQRGGLEKGTYSISGGERGRHFFGTPRNYRDMSRSGRSNRKRYETGCDMLGGEKKKQDKFFYGGGIVHWDR